MVYRRECRGGIRRARQYVRNSHLRCSDVYERGGGVLCTGQNSGNGNSFISGIHAGYNWQVAPKYVLGVEADIQEISSSRQTVSSEVPAFPDETIFSTINPAPTYLGTVRGRVGFLAAPALLLYGTGGLAYGGRGSITQNDVDSSGGCFITGTWCHPYGTNFGTQFGFAAGAGGEWMIKPNWSVKAEYLYYRLGGGSSSTLTNNFLTNGFRFRRWNARLVKCFASGAVGRQHRQSWRSAITSAARRREV